MRPTKEARTIVWK